MIFQLILQFLQKRYGPMDRRTNAQWSQLANLADMRLEMLISAKNAAFHALELK